MRIVPAAQLDSEPLQLRDISFFVGQVSHGDLDVDDRLGCQARHGCRADVVDSQGNRSELAGDQAPPRCESGGPSHVVSDDVDRVGSLAAFSHLESRPEGGRDDARQSVPFLEGQLARLHPRRLAGQRVQVDHGRSPAFYVMQANPRDNRVGVALYPGSREAFRQSWSAVKLARHPQRIPGFSLPRFSAGAGARPLDGLNLPREPALASGGADPVVTSSVGG